MRKALTTLGQNKRQQDASPGLYAGAELDATTIRAGIFDSAGRLIGKSKRSTKLERGDSVVLNRVTRCILDAVDECDLPINDLNGVGLGITRGVLIQWDLTKAQTTPGLLMQDIERRLEDLLGLRVFVEPDSQLAALGIYEAELETRQPAFVTILCGAELNAGLLLNGELPDDKTLTPLINLMASAQQEMIAKFNGPSMLELNKKALRKAARRRDPQIRPFAEEIAKHAGAAAARLLELYEPQCIAFGGALIEELKDNMMPIIEQTVRNTIESEVDFANQMHASDLGDNATQVGASFYARRKAGC